MQLVNNIALVLGYAVLVVLSAYAIWIVRDLVLGALHAWDYQKWTLKNIALRGSSSLRGWELVKARIKDFFTHTWEFMGQSTHDFSTSITMSMKNEDEDGEDTIRPALWKGRGNWILFDGTKGPNWDPNNCW